MVQAISCWLLTVEAQVRSKVIPCEVYGGQSGSGTDFPLSSISVFSCQYYPTSAPHAPSSHEDKHVKSGNLQKPLLFRKSGRSG
jgi:hypothetical protein